jgi:atypical dual specificity phosphatase
VPPPPTVSRLLFWPTFLWNALLGRVLGLRRWWDRVDHHLLLGALPLRPDVAALAAEGVAAVVNTCEEYAGPVEEYRRYGIEQLRVPTTDFHPPTLDSIRLAVAFIQQHVVAGQTVYVHCKAGRARSATVVLCWLVAYRGMTVEQAQRHLLACRPHVMATLGQRAVVKEWAASCATALAGDSGER